MGRNHRSTGGRENTREDEIGSTSACRCAFKSFRETGASYGRSECRARSLCCGVCNAGAFRDCDRCSDCNRDSAAPGANAGTSCQYCGDGDTVSARSETARDRDAGTFSICGSGNIGIAFGDNDAASKTTSSASDHSTDGSADNDHSTNSDHASANHDIFGIPAGARYTRAAHEQTTVSNHTAGIISDREHCAFSDAI